MSEINSTDVPDTTASPDRPEASAAPASPGGPLPSTGASASDPAGPLAEPAAAASMTWLSVPEVAARLGLRDREVRAMLREGQLLSVRRATGAGPQIPADTIVEGEDGPEVLPSLRGTLTLLADCGLDEDEAMRWLLTEHSRFSSTPLEALRQGRTHVVREEARLLLL